MWGAGRNAKDQKKGWFDCSGFVMYAYNQAGIDVGKSGNTDTLVKKGKKVSYKNIQVGDMVFFDTYKKNGHVGIYIGNGKFIGAQTTTGVGIVDMTKGYYKDKFKGVVRRVAPSSNKSSNSGTTNFSLDDAKYSAYGKHYNSYKQNLSAAFALSGFSTKWAGLITEIVKRESGFRSSNPNPTSTADGYGQFLKSTRATYEKKTGLSYKNPVHQLVMMFHYVKDRYKTPEKALAFWNKHKWY